MIRVDPTREAGRLIASRFKIQKTAGEGGSGTVYQARDLRTNAIVALKLVRVQSEANAVRFEREASALAAIDHPAVVRYVDHGEVTPGGDTRFLAMEWLEGVDLRARLAGHSDASHRASASVDRDVSTARLADTGSPPQNLDGHVSRARAASASLETTHVPEDSRTPLPDHEREALPVSSVLTLARRMSEALAAVHGLGLLHRDIKPSNIFLVGGDVARAKLVDFGVVRNQEVPVGDDLTKPGTFVGTPMYTSPEQARNEQSMNAASDVWSLGVVLYEALTGVCPFRANHFTAVLARILFDEVKSVGALVPFAPRRLTTLVDQMLEKAAFDRPANGQAVREALVGIEDSARESGPHTSAAAMVRGAVIPEPSEQRINCVLFARGGRLRSLNDTFAETWVPQEAAASKPALGTSQGLVEAVRRYGDTEILVDGTVLVVPRADNPKDQAMEAGRAALNLAALDPEMRAFIAIGRGSAQGVAPADDLFDRAVGALGTADSGEIRLDLSTANLLEARFQVQRGEPYDILRRELPEEARRLLLGQPTPFVGRRRELTLLESTWEEASYDEVPRAVLVVGHAGSGKSRLRWEFHRRVRGRDEPCTVLSGRGDSLAAGAPFGLIRTPVRRWFGVEAADDAARRQSLVLERCRALFGDDPAHRKTVAFLGEIVGAEFPDDFDPSLAAARNDRMLRGQNMGEAFVAWLGRLTAIGPVLLTLEDIHWGDSPSLKFVDEALRELEASPLMVLALTRPGLERQFPNLWQGRPVQELRLMPLTPRACARLVDQVLDAHPVEIDRAQIIARCEGNAFYLEELIRASVDGGAGLVPDTVYGMVHARLDALGPGATSVLKFAAVFGERFWKEGLARQLADQGGAAFVEEGLARLVEAEVVRPATRSSLPGTREFRFHHALLRDAAYGMLSDRDRMGGHRRAARWLDEMGLRDPLTMAGHFDRGGDSATAVTWYARAAESALDGGDLDGADTHVRRGLDLGAEGALRGTLLTLGSVAAYWRSDYQTGCSMGLDARGVLVPGSREWFIASGSALVSSARRADYTVVEEIFDSVLATAPHNDAHSERLIAMCRGAFQLIFAAKFERADAVLAQISTDLEDDASVDALTRAQGHHVQGVRQAHIGDVAKFLMHLERAVACFELAGDRRNAALEHTTVAWCWAEIGDLERATEACRANLEHCEEIKNVQAVTYAKVNLGYILALRGPTLRDEARTVLQEAVRACRAVGNQRLEGWARAHLTAVEHAAGDHDEELAHAEAAVELLGTSPGLHAWALATRARAQLAVGALDAALVDAEAAMETLERLGGILQGESLPPLVYAQVQTRLELDTADAARRGAIARLERRAERLGRDDWRAMFMNLPDSQQTLMLGVRREA